MYLYQMIKNLLTSSDRLLHLHVETKFTFTVSQSLDIPAEKINLEMADNTDITSLASRVPDESARYHVFTYKHTHEGDYTESIGEYLVIN